MSTEKVSGYISSITFNTGEQVDIKPNDIVVFVGPNNVGKSQALKDIYALSDKKLKSIVVSDIRIAKSEGSLLSLLNSVSIGDDRGSTICYSLFGKAMWFNKSVSEGNFAGNPYYCDFRDLFVVNLDTAARLNICIPPKNIKRSEPKGHPIHFAAFDGKYRRLLSSNFKRAFGIDVTPNTQYGSIIPLCIGEPVNLDNGQYSDEQERLEKYADILASYKQVQDQGDGIKSFTGILLYLMLDYYKTYLIDEPESFLHPPQARIMGEIIGQTLSENKQAFISTHSEEIIKGLLEYCPERIKIIRITRQEDRNVFSILSNEKINEIWSDPLLKYSNIMSSLFHKVVVLCESDSDCKMYSIVDRYIKEVEGKYSEVLFIHCGGKHRMAKIASSLRVLNIDIRLILDMDILNEKNTFKSILDVYGIEWSSVEKDYNIIVSSLDTKRVKIGRDEARLKINNVLDNAKGEELTDEEMRRIRSAVKVNSKWDDLKSMGVCAIPNGDATTSFNRMNDRLLSNGIYIVLVGELEGFVRQVGGHGPEWVNRVIERYPDLSSDVYKDIRGFVSKMKL